MIENGFVACLFCGSERNMLLSVDENGAVVPPEAGITIECLDCRHLFAIDVSQATEQVYVGLHKMACPDTCTMPGVHQKD
jgi:hypothetical protein